LVADAENVALVCSTFNLSSRYIDEELDWSDWLLKLFAAMRIKEMDMYERYMLAGGKSEDWTWVYHVEYIMPSAEPMMVEQKILKVYGGKKPTIKENSLPVDYLRRYYKEVTQLEDGTFIDEFGNKITKPDEYIFVPIPEQGDL
jgi:hypothetical protein